MFAEQRRQKILDLLIEEGSTSVSALTKTFEVTAPTVRQDLERLEKDGYIVRKHGGAFLKSVPEQVQSMSLHHKENMDKKALIGRRAATYVENDDSIILDAGSTTTEMAKNLHQKENLKVITNALNIALMLGAQPKCDIHLTGGQFKAPTLSLTAEKAAEFFEGLYVEKLFLATGAVSIKSGMTFPGLNDIQVKRAMIKSASHVYLLADSSKIGKTQFMSLGGIELIHTFITDAGITDEDRQQIENLGVDVVIAE